MEDISESSHVSEKGTDVKIYKLGLNDIVFVCNASGIIMKFRNKPVKPTNLTMRKDSDEMFERDESLEFGEDKGSGY
jgi:hypothetical protein